MGPRSVAPTQPAHDLDPRLDRFAQVCDDLVVGTGAALADVSSEVESLCEAVVEHLGSAGAAELGPRAPTSSLDPNDRRLQAEHERFRTSVAQLRWFLGIVERDDHGGNRQALGQYGRLVVEALRRHCADERGGAVDLPEGGSRGSPPSSKNPK